MHVICMTCKQRKNPTATPPRPLPPLSSISPTLLRSSFSFFTVILYPSQPGPGFARLQEPQAALHFLFMKRNFGGLWELKSSEGKSLGRRRIMTPLDFDANVRICLNADLIVLGRVSYPRVAPGLYFIEKLWCCVTYYNVFITMCFSPPCLSGSRSNNISKTLPIKTKSKIPKSLLPSLSPWRWGAFEAPRKPQQKKKHWSTSWRCPKRAPPSPLQGDHSTKHKHGNRQVSFHVVAVLLLAVL